MLGAYGEITLDDDDDSLCAKEELDFRIQAQKMYPAWLDRLHYLSNQPIFTSSGTFVIGNHLGPQDFVNLTKIKEEADAHNESCQWVDPLDVPGLHPSTHLMPYRCLFLPNEGFVDSSDLLKALQYALLHSNLCQHLDDSVVKIAPGKGEGEWEIFTQQHQSYITKCLIVCAGSQTANILGMETYSRAELPALYFGKGTSITLDSKLNIPHTIRTPNRAFACGIHALPRASGLYIGATNLLGTDHDAEKGIDPGELHMLLDQAIHQINTGIRKEKIKDLRYGFRPIATTRRPLVGKTKLPGLFLATGTYRNGILMAPLIAEMLVSEVLGHTTTNPFFLMRVVHQTFLSP